MGVYYDWSVQNLMSFAIAEVNAVGEGMLNVCGLGGDIQQGDLLCASNLPGKAQKQSDNLQRNYTVAKARISYSFESPEQVAQIPVFYRCG